MNPDDFPFDDFMIEGEKPVDIVHKVLIHIMESDLGHRNRKRKLIEEVLKIFGELMNVKMHINIGNIASGGHILVEPFQKIDMFHFYIDFNSCEVKLLNEMKKPKLF